MPASVLLLKAADEMYKAAFKPIDESAHSRRGMEIHFADVLTFEYVNTVQLLDVLTHLDTYSGILLTSPRSAIAVVNVVKGLDIEMREDVLEKLRSVSVFSVGTATSRELLPLGVVCKGDDAGSADMLSEYLHKDGNLPVDCKDKPMMFLCGDKRRDVLPDSFQSRGLPLEELVVYQTCPVQNVEFPLKVPDWIVFFSPSGLNAVKDLHLPWESIRKAAIGKTSAAALHEHAVTTGQTFWEADVIAPKPKPESLADAIFAFEDDYKL
ncbi:unnamed protein product [Peronospora destructor]|uniref:Uroporphyrinogen-III synthase n=1 Tax=Peronospora destructor TaxID=86335 RepID=A0AAV0TSZ6_9STRA|nr:unnamed protein product [Peronospora destructor]CAI5744971.1 unnamed protein product [Peronospora destructor]